MSQWLDDFAGRLGAMLAEAEERYGENAAGTYPTEVEMTTRLAFLTARRAAEDAKEPRATVEAGA